MIPYQFLVYQSADGWRWRLVARNGRIVADSGEAYARKAGAIRACKAMQAYVLPQIVTVEGE